MPSLITFDEALELAAITERGDIEAVVELRQIIQRVVRRANCSVTQKPMKGGLFCMLLDDDRNDLRLRRHGTHHN